MGLEREIEQLFQRVVEIDLDKIGRRAQPSYHSYSTSPPAYSFPEGSHGSPKLKFEEVIYQVQRIELNPLRAAALREIVDRRTARNLGPDKNEDTKKIKDLLDETPSKVHEAADHYIGSTGGVVAAITFEQIDVDTSNPAEPTIDRYDVIKFFGVPYVRSNGLLYSEFKDYPKDSTVLDRWPEYILLKGLKDVGDEEYIRHDLKK
jgi:hypothetical protein